MKSISYTATSACDESRRTVCRETTAKSTGENQPALD